MIETLDEWNERLGFCGCCEMPVCPEPSIATEEKTAALSACGVLMTKPTPFAASYPTPPLADFKKWYETRIVTYEENHYDATGTLYPSSPITKTTTLSHSRDGSGDCNFNTVVVQTGFLFFGTYTITGYTYAAGAFEVTFDSRGAFPSAGFAGYDRREFLGGKTEAETITDIEAAILLKFDAIGWGDPYTYAASHSRTHTAVSSLYPGEEIIQSITKTKLRFRFRIPSSHEGNYFKITYDIAEFPTDPLVDPSFVSEDTVVEWTGPGDLEDPDAASWFTDWIEIDPPETEGERRVVNPRFTCYHGAKYGTKPQTFGESFAPPAP